MTQRAKAKSSPAAFLVSYWPSIIVVAVILYATLVPEPLPDDQLPELPHLDKLIHAIMFGGLTGAMAFDRQRASNRAARAEGHVKAKDAIAAKVMWALAAASTAFGILIERAQLAMGIGRGCDPIDMAADAFGAVVAVYAAPPVIRWLLKVFQRPSSRV